VTKRGKTCTLCAMRTPSRSVSLRLSDTVFVWLQVEDALNVMREAHEYGLALVCECAQDKAEETCESLRLCGLICTIEPR
jgi:ATP-dependent Clp protease adapter protein ClpS